MYMHCILSRLSESGGQEETAVNVHKALIPSLISTKNISELDVASIMMLV